MPVCKHAALKTGWRAAGEGGVLEEWKEDVRVVRSLGVVYVHSNHMPMLGESLKAEREEEDRAA